MEAQDHDLLVQLHEQVKQVRIDIQSLGTNNTSQINDHENRIRLLEAFKSVIFGGLILSNVVIVPILIWLVVHALK